MNTNSLAAFVLRTKLLRLLPSSFVTVVTVFGCHGITINSNIITINLILSIILSIIDY